MQTQNGFTCFHSYKDHFSNWHIRQFKIKNITFNCGEQAMMYSKAMFFGDLATAAKILNEPDPREQKKLGKEVKNFVEEDWVNNRVRIVSAILFQKFNQHPDLKQMLLATEGTEIVEASKWDRIWGIGMEANDPNFLDRSRWGLNLLGQCLMIVREHFLKLEREAKYNGPTSTPQP
jgi:ribA/ribD-fused uncharacterized protein